MVSKSKGGQGGLSRSELDLMQGIASMSAECVSPKQWRACFRGCRGCGNNIPVFRRLQSYMFCNFFGTLRKHVLVAYSVQFANAAA